jgi:hypothetical protein
VEKRIPSQLRPKRKTEEKTKKQEYIKVFWKKGTWKKACAPRRTSSHRPSTLGTTATTRGCSDLACEPRWGVSWHPQPLSRSDPKEVVGPTTIGSLLEQVATSTWMTLVETTGVPHHTYWGTPPVPTRRCRWGPLAGKRNAPCCINREELERQGEGERAVNVEGDSKWTVFVGSTDRLCAVGQKLNIMIFQAGSWWAPCKCTTPVHRLHGNYS